MHCNLKRNRGGAIRQHAIATTLASRDRPTPKNIEDGVMAVWRSSRRRGCRGHCAYHLRALWNNTARQRMPRRAGHIGYPHMQQVSMRCFFWNSLRPSDRAGKAAPRPHAQRLTRAFEAELQWVRKQGLPRIAHGRRASCRERSPGEGGAGRGLPLWWFSTRPRPSDPKLRHR